MGPFGELRQWRRSIVSTACATSRALPAILVFCSARGGSAAVAASPSSVGGARGSFFSFDPADWLSSDAAFAMATTGSARILGFPDIGRIAKGAAADLVFLDRGYCHYAPLRQPLRQIVFAETGVAMREVMVSGNARKVAARSGSGTIEASRKSSTTALAVISSSTPVGFSFDARSAKVAEVLRAASRQPSAPGLKGGTGRRRPAGSGR
jgi:hypothetical protein